jgi:formamidopyrimidine-DNA glycosylase
VPELPDLSILADALDAGLVGRPLMAASTPQSLVLRGTPAELAAFTGQLLQSVTRRGKFLVFEFARDRIIVNAMLTGRLGFAEPKSKAWPGIAAVFTFGPVSEESGRATDRPTAGWLKGADWLPAADRPIELRYRDATRMGKIYLVPAGVTRAIAGWDEQGPDALDPELTLDVWRRRIAKHNGELKNLLRNQVFVTGIGNAYSDEILWEARLAPFRTRASLAPDEVDALYVAARKVLPWAIDELRVLVPPKLEVEQRKFLRAHWKGGEACPRCGTRLTEVKAGGFVTTWCRGCQR